MAATVFGYVRDGWLITDRNGVVWVASEVIKSDEGVITLTITELLLDGDEDYPKVHKITKDPLDPCNAEPPVEVVKQSGRLESMFTPEAAEAGWEAGRKAVQTVKEQLGAEVLMEVTDAQQQALDTTTEADPTLVPAFVDMDVQQRRTHLFLLHGLDCFDVDGTARLLAMHTEADEQREAGQLQAKYLPHTHREPK